MRLPLLVRHQVGAAVATGIDFASMILWVESGLGSSVSGTAIGATAGALSNFALGRTWIFPSDAARVRRQLARYGLVALGSLGLNTFGQRLLMGAAGWPYPLTRAIIAVLVGVLWNYPMHRWFVFAQSKPHELATS